MLEITSVLQMINWKIYAQMENPTSFGTFQRRNQSPKADITTGDNDPGMTPQILFSATNSANKYYDMCFQLLYILKRTNHFFWQEKGVFIT